ncbi:MAG TPA: DMT family transporter [Chloroflexota bacterium]
MPSTLVTHLALAACIAIWSGNFAVSKVAVGDAPPFLLATVRFLLASLLLLPIVARVAPAQLAVKRDDLPLVAVLGLLGVVGSNALFFIGLSLAPAADGAMLNPTTVPIFTIVATRWLYGERLGRDRLLGVALSLVGVPLILGGTAQGWELSSARLLGDLLFLLGGFVWAFYAALGRAALQRFSPLGASLHTCVAGVLMLLPLCLVTGSWQPTALQTPTFWLNMAYMAGLSTVGAFLLWYRAVQGLGPARAAIFTNLVPVGALGLAVALLGERPSPVQLVGTVIVLAGVWQANRPVRSRRRGAP